MIDLSSITVDDLDRDPYRTYVELRGLGQHFARVQLHVADRAIFIAFSELRHDYDCQSSLYWHDSQLEKPLRVNFAGRLRSRSGYLSQGSTLAHH